MSLTGQLIDLIENKSIDNEDIEVASWYLLDAIANIAAGLNTDQGRILRRWFLEEIPDTSRKVLFMGALMHILEYVKKSISCYVSYLLDPFLKFISQCLKTIRTFPQLGKE